MRTKKVLRRLAEVSNRPEVLNVVARDVGVALARGKRDELQVVARAIAENAPPGDAPGGAAAEEGAGDYWAGFATALGMMLASYEAAHEHQDARAAAMRALGTSSARAVLCELAEAPRAGAELAAMLRLTPGAVSKILRSLRAAGLVRVLGGSADAGIPERGARKPHGLTSMGAAIANELMDETVPEERLEAVGHR